MQNPAQGIHRDLLPHVHCVSTFRYPTQQTVHAQQFANWLREAPDIVQSKAPFFWTYLDRCQNGYIYLSWQPLDSLGTNAATDGYIWPQHEQVYQIEVNDGLILEVYAHKAGYAYGDQMALHARHRYRLLSSRNSNTAVDPTLFITHYSAADPADRLPSSMIAQNDPRTQHILSQRAYLQSCGALQKKDFLLRDPAQWPQIQWPQSPGLPRGQSYTSRTPQAMAYPTHVSAPPSKRARTQQHRDVSASSIMAAVEDDIEETSQGDMFDHMTPRDVSLMRYKQNHRWMDDVLGLQVPINDIKPVDLGLGLKGGMKDLTEGIFHAQSGDASDDSHLYDYVGKLDAGKADQFRERVSARIAADNAEMEKMKAKHAKRMAKIHKYSGVVAAEKTLRKAVHDPSDTGNEFWRLEGKVEVDDDGDVRPQADNMLKVDDIVAQVETLVDRRLTTVRELRRVQDGGFEEAVIPPPRQEPQPLTHIDVTMSNTGSVPHAGYQGGYNGENSQTTYNHQQSTQGSRAYNLPQYQQQHQQPAQQYQPMQAQAQPQYQHSRPTTSDTMQSMQSQHSYSQSATTNQQSYPSQYNGEAQRQQYQVPQPINYNHSNQSQAQSHPSLQSQPIYPTSQPLAQPTNPYAPQSRPSISQPHASNDVPDPKAPYRVQDEFLSLNSPGGDMASNTAPSGGPNTAGGDLGTVGGDMGVNSGDLDLGMDVGMDIDDSAFGDAFHGVEVARAGEGDEDPAAGM